MEPDGSSGSESDTGATSTGGGGSSEGSSGEDCVDLDGDGAGQGCDVQDCDDDNPATSQGCLYLGPGGDDGNPGTREQPWRTFAHAFGQLSEGDSLVVLDGRYMESEVGTPMVDCSEGEGVSGTASAPIFIRAEHDLQAVIDREGRAYGVGTRECDHLRFRGFSIVSMDNALDQTGRWMGTVGVLGAQDVEVRHVFGHHSNRYFNEHGFLIAGSTDVLVEDSEMHEFFRTGFSVYSSDEVTLRRCYAHSHELADLDACPELPDCADPDDSELAGTLDCPKCSAGSPQRGDSSFSSSFSNDVLMENCVSEGSARGFSVRGGDGQDGDPAGRNVRVVQSLSIADDVGVLVSVGAEPTNAPPGVLFEDVAIIEPADTGMEFRHPDGLQVRNISVFGRGEYGIRVAESDSTYCRDGCSVDFERVLVLGVTTGLRLDVAPESWSFTRSFVDGNTDYDYPDFATDAPFDAEGNVRDNLEGVAEGVGLDACRVTVPADSNLADPFGDGVPVGANVTARMMDGVPTGEPLWSPEGAFPCNADPVEPDQVPGEQCGDLADRVGFSGACPVP